MNILFAFADDWGRYASIYKDYESYPTVNSIINTPNIDRIGREGALFRNAMVPAPSCTPCRSAVLSGRYFWQTGLGAILLGAHWDNEIATYPLELEKNGYHIGYTYKVWSPGDNPDMPYGGERNAYMNHGNDFGEFSHYVTKRSAETSIDAAKQELYDEVLGNFTDFLDNRTDDKPFCYWWGPVGTHRTWEKGSGKALWGLEPNDLEGKMPKCLPDVHEVREDFSDYLGEVLALDAGLGILIEELKRRGELDNTLIVVSGDHGIPGMHRGKCNLYNLGSDVALLARYPKKIKAGRVIDDLVNLQDLAPTFLDFAEVEIPKEMTATSLKSLLCNEDDGYIAESRDFVVIGRERHVDCAREGYLPYPQRAIRTKDFLYIVNFEPDRWPMGDPCGLEDPNYQIPYSDLETKTFIAYPDFDASPTKAWMIYNRNRAEHRPLFELAVGKRPFEELYHIPTDQDTIKNVANDKRYAQIKESLKVRLLDVLKEQRDPRIVEENCRFERLPFTCVCGSPNDFFNS